jgi:hypothetical protein
MKNLPTKIAQVLMDSLLIIIPDLLKKDSTNAPQTIS